MGGTKSFDEGIYNSMQKRADKYKHAATYCIKELQNKVIASRMLDEYDKVQ